MWHNPTPVTCPVFCKGIIHVYRTFLDHRDQKNLLSEKFCICSAETPNPIYQKSKEVIQVQMSPWGVIQPKQQFNNYNIKYSIYLYAKNLNKSKKLLKRK